METSPTGKPLMARESETSTAGNGPLGEVDLLDVLIVLAKRKWLITKISLALTTVAIVGSLLLPNRYSATATIMPPRQNQSTASMLMSQLTAGGLGSMTSLVGKDLGLKDPNDFYVGLLKSRTVQDNLISKFDLQHAYRTDRLSETRKELASYTNITSGKDGIIAISFEDKDRKRAAAIANSYVTELRNLLQHLAVNEASQRRLFFEQQVQQAKDDLANAEVALRDTQQRTGMIQLDSQSKAMIEAVSRIRAQMAAKEVQLHAMGSFATEQNPDYVVARQELAGLRAQLAKYEEHSSPDAGDPLVSTGKIPAVGLEYVRRLREVKYRETMFELLAKQYEAARLDESKEAAIIQVVDPADVPDKKSWPHRALIAFTALVVGILIGCIWTFVIEAYECSRANRRVSERLAELKLHIRFKDGIERLR